MTSCDVVREVLNEHLASCRERHDRDGFPSPDMILVLQRLVGDNRASDAIAKITMNAREIRNLADQCMQADLRIRMFHKWLTEKRETSEQLCRHRQSVEDLRQFIDENFQIVFGWPIPKAEYQDALNRIDALITMRQQGSDGAISDLGVTRKSGQPSAAENAAIGYLVSRVETSFGKPYAPQVAILAEIALNIGEVSEDRVRDALKARRRKLDALKARRRKLGHSTP